jgi:hypothetical protein
MAMVVPTTNVVPTAMRPQERVNSTLLLMSAAEMHRQGRLVEPKAEESKP